MTRSRHVRVPAVVLLATVALGAGCGSDEHATQTQVDPTDGPTPAAVTVPVAATSATVAAESVTVGNGGLPPVDVQDVTFEQLGDLLPDLSPATTAATYVVELRLRTLEVTAEGTTLCLGGGDAGLQPDTCTDLADGRGVLAYSDDAATRVYAVLTTDQVAVVFERPGGGLTCFSEPVSGIAPLVVWWCEDQFPPLIRFELASGRRYQVTVG